MAAITILRFSVCWPARQFGRQTYGPPTIRLPSGTPTSAAYLHAAIIALLGLITAA